MKFHSVGWNLWNCLHFGKVSMELPTNLVGYSWNCLHLGEISRNFMKFQREVVGGEICYHYIRPWTFASTRSCFGIRLRVFFSSLKAPFLSSPVPKPASSPFLFLLTTAANHPRLMIMGAPSSRMISARMKSACARLSGCTEAFTHAYALALHIFSVPFVFSLTGRTWLDDGGKRVSFPNGRHLDKCNRENNISSKCEKKKNNEKRNLLLKLDQGKFLWNQQGKECYNFVNPLEEGHKERKKCLRSHRSAQGKRRK